jgi:predicted polyphosphate/ATP-dependent NAD kinase
MMNCSEKRSQAMKKLGLIVNPIAGMGGRVGLKGSDGNEILKRAKEMGAQAEAPERAIRALESIAFIKDSIEVVTYPYDMGEEEAITCGIAPKVIGHIKRGKTDANDTFKAARKMVQLAVDLLLFAGGDGTARDIYRAVGDRIPALGIPTGVKMHSAVFAISPKYAGEIARDFLEGNSLGIRLTEGEVMDIDEAAFRNNQVSARLYGYLKIPFKKNRLQGPKSGGCAGEREALASVATDVVNNMKDDCLYIVGTGTTTRAVMQKLGLPNTLLGVDAVLNYQLVGSDLNESQLLEVIRERSTKIIVGVIGGQGYIFGRGNQQISAEVIKKVGKEGILVLATVDKITTLKGAALLVDTGDKEIDKHLSGYMKVISGLGERIVLKIEY